MKFILLLISNLKNKTIINGLNYNIQFCIDNLQMKRNRTKKFDLPGRRFEPQILNKNWYSTCTEESYFGLIDGKKILWQSITWIMNGQMWLQNFFTPFNGPDGRTDRAFVPLTYSLSFPPLFFKPAAACSPSKMTWILGGHQQWQIDFDTS